MIEVSLRLPAENDLQGVVEQLESGGIGRERIEVLTREPLPPSALPVRSSRMSKVGVIGALLGLSAAAAGLITITLSAHLRTGGMPLIAPLPLGVITYEMTLLAAILAIVAALFLGAGLGPGRRVPPHPELRQDEAIVSVICGGEDEAKRAHSILSIVAAAARVYVPLLVLILLAPTLNGGSAAGQTFQRSCAPCHGTAGEGRIGPQIADRAWSADAFESRVRDGGLLMPSFSVRDISEAQLRTLLAFVNRLPAPTASGRLPSPSQNEPGASAFETNCIGCHGVEARGGIGPGILNTPLGPSQFREHVRRGGTIMPAFSRDRLSDGEVEEIYAYLHPPLQRADPGDVDELPAVPNYPRDSLFALAGLALLGQIVSERRRRSAMRLRTEVEAVHARFPMSEDGRLQVRVF